MKTKLHLYSHWYHDSFGVGTSKIALCGRDTSLFPRMKTTIDLVDVTCHACLKRFPLLPLIKSKEKK